MELTVYFLRAVRRRTFICCHNVRISASSAAHDRNRSATNNEPDKIFHHATASPDSRSTASQIEFATGTTLLSEKFVPGRCIVYGRWTEERLSGSTTSMRIFVAIPGL
jgi:hypothetical protein